MDISQQMRTLEKQLTTVSIEERRKIKRQLVELYVQYGEYHKSSDQPNDQAAIIALKKALTYEPNHPIAHYRLGHLYYKNNDYKRTLFHFMTIGESQQLDDVQRYLVHLLLADVMMKQVKHSLEEIESLEIEADRRMKPFLYRISVPSVTDLHRMYVCKITATDKQITYADAANEIVEEGTPQCVKLVKLDGDLSLRIGVAEPVKLSLTEFYLLYFTLRANRALSNQDLLHQFQRDNHEQTVETEELLRQAWHRLSLKLGEQLETFIIREIVDRRVTYRFNSEYTYIVITPIDHVF